MSLAFDEAEYDDSRTISNIDPSNVYAPPSILAATADPSPYPK